MNIDTPNVNEMKEKLARFQKTLEEMQNAVETVGALTEDVESIKAEFDTVTPPSIPKIPVTEGHREPVPIGPTSSVSEGEEDRYNPSMPMYIAGTGESIPYVDEHATAVYLGICMLTDDIAPLNEYNEYEFNFAGKIFHYNINQEKCEIKALSAVIRKLTDLNLEGKNNDNNA